MSALCEFGRRRHRSLVVHGSCVAKVSRRKRFSVLVVRVVVRVRMSFFGIRNLIAVSVAVPAVTVTMSAMSVVVEEEQSHNVRRQSQASDNQDKLRLCDLLRLYEALNGLKEDAHA